MPAKTAKLKWGWLEWFLVCQLMSPGLLFIPGLTSLRLFIRIFAFLIAPGAWALIFFFGKHRPGGEEYPARPWAIACIAYLTLSVLHPDTNSLLAGVAHVGLYASILSPIFWVGWDLKSSRQIGRIMAILFACNAISATLGILQVYRPETFNPPVIPSFNDEFSKLVLTYQTDSGETIIRPCGLSDSPGAASGAGMLAALMGMCFAMRPIGPIRRLACLGAAFLGVAVIYYTQVRTLLLMLVGCMGVLAAMFAMQGNMKKATTLMGLGGGLIFGALAWVVARVGSPILNRFASILEKDPLSFYQENRGKFVSEALGDMIWNYPVGAGLGRWGQIYSYFGNMNYPMIWVEVQFPAWVVDGGFPLLLLYLVALVLAMIDSAWIALKCRNPDLKFWASVIVSVNLSVLAMTFANCPFLAAPGLQFWVLATALHVAYVRERAERRRMALMFARSQNAPTHAAATASGRARAGMVPG